MVCGYRLYRWLYLRAQRAQAIEDFYGPEKSHLSRSPGPSGFASLPSQINLAGQSVAGGLDASGRRSSGFAGARSRQLSWGGESWGGPAAAGMASRENDFTPPAQDSRDTSPTPYNASRSSLSGVPNQSARSSFAGPARRPYYSSSASGSQILSPSRTMSSFSSPYLGATPAGSQQFPSGNRLVGAPHNQHSRIEVVPPAPLAPPQSQVIATNKSQLDFAPTSAIGSASTLFGSHPAVAGLAPAEGGPTAMVTSSSGSGSGSGSHANAASDEWDLVSGDEAQERLEPAFDSSSSPAHSTGAAVSPIIPPSSASASASGESSPSDPRARGLPRVPAEGLLDADTAAAAAAVAGPSSTVPPPTGSSLPRHPQLPLIETGAAFDLSGHHTTRPYGEDATEEPAEPRSPLEKLQMEMRHYSLQELSREGPDHDDDDDEGGAQPHHNHP